MNFRIGQGYDVHKLVEGRKLILGGVEIPHPTGLLGHSDADALLHAITDALLGAVALGDIGRHFPDTDPRYKGADSRVLLRGAVALLAERGWRPVNVDATIIAPANAIPSCWWSISWPPPVTAATTSGRISACPVARN